MIEATARSEKIARDIINVLAENGCTINESEGMLRYVGICIRGLSTVKKVTEKLFETEDD